MMSAFHVIVCCCLSFVLTFQFGDTAPAEKSDQQPPSFAQTGSLIDCARSCSAKQQCQAFIYGNFSRAGYDCGYTTAKGRQDQKSGFFISKITRDASADIVAPKELTYIQLNGVRSQTITLPPKDDNAFLVGAQDSKHILKITASLKCIGCGTDDVVSIYNVRDDDDVTAPIPPTDQSEGAVACQTPTFTLTKSVFVAANGSYVLVRVGSSSAGQLQGKLTFSTEKWDDPYTCNDCSNVKTLSHMCKDPAYKRFVPYMKFHLIPLPTSQASDKSHSNSGPNSNSNNNNPKISIDSGGSKGPSSKSTPSKSPPSTPSTSNIKISERTSTDDAPANSTTKSNRIRGKKDDEDSTTSAKTSSTDSRTTPKSHSREDKDDDDHSNNNNDNDHKDNDNHDSNNNNDNKYNNGENNQSGQQTGGSTSSSANSGVIGGAVGGVLVGGAVVGAVVGGLLYRRHKKNKVVPSEVEIDLDENAKSSSPPCAHDSKALVLRPDATPPPLSSPSAATEDHENADTESLSNAEQQSA